MAHTYNWNAAFEAAPDDDNYGYEIDDYIRRLEVAVRERMEIDHYWKDATSQTNDGLHKKITLPVLAADPTEVASGIILYAKDVSTKAELFMIDEDGDIIQITSGGEMNDSPIATGDVMLFYADTAPTGWTIQNTLDDKTIMVTKGSAAGGQTGGGAHATGTWTISGITGGSHALTIAELAAHTHSGLEKWDGTGGVVGFGGSYYNRRTGKLTTSTGSDTAHSHGASAHAGTWRPAAYCFIMCKKD